MWNVRSISRAYGIIALPSSRHRHHRHGAIVVAAFAALVVGCRFDGLGGVLGLGPSRATPLSPNSGTSAGFRPNRFETARDPKRDELEEMQEAPDRKDSGMRPAGAAVVVNGVDLSAAEVDEIAARHGVHIPAGRYWYDTHSGAWGLEGGPTFGFTIPGATLGGPLRSDASGGGHGSLTAVFINGREIHPLDLAALRTLTQVLPGRYSVDAFGNASTESGIYLGNLAALERGGTTSAYQRATAGGYIGGDGQTSYFFDPSSGASVIPGEGVSY
jgi:hypothetical protein